MAACVSSSVLCNLQKRWPVNLPMFSDTPVNFYYWSITLHIALKKQYDWKFVLLGNQEGGFQLADEFWELANTYGLER